MWLVDLNISSFSNLKDFYFLRSKDNQQIGLGMAENGDIPNQKASLDLKDHQSNVQERGAEGKKSVQSQATIAPSLDSFLDSLAIFGFIMVLYYLCDDDHYFPATERTYSRDLFWFLVLLLFAVAAGLTRKETADKILNREQTEEWKGWMQVMFVWYHYFKAAETYNAIRVFIAAYVWMTGFGKYTRIDDVILVSSIKLY